MGPRGERGERGFNVRLSIINVQLINELLRETIVSLQGSMGLPGAMGGRGEPGLPGEMVSIKT